jgi:NDP-hexose 4-ketoreductase
MARLLVLGAGGFIGRAVRRELLAGGHQVACLDRMPAEAAGSDEAWFQLDLLEASADAFGEIVRRVGPDTLLNCAGLVDGPTEQLVRANVLLVARLLEVARAEGVRLVHLGSAAEYGASEPGRSVSEDDAPHPVTPYAITKLGGTLLVTNAVESGAVSGVVLRLFNPLGPGMPPGSMPGRAASLVLEARASGAESITMGPLDAWRDFLDLRDAASAIIEAALHRGVTPPLLNVGTGAAVLARDVVQAIADAAGWQGEVVEQAALASPRSAGVSWQQASTTRIESVLGWRPTRSLGEAAASVLAGEG